MKKNAEINDYFRMSISEMNTRLSGQDSSTYIA